MACPALQYFPISSHKGHDLRETSTTNEIFLIVGRSKQDIITNVHWAPCKVPVILVRFQMKYEFSQNIFRKIVKYQIKCKFVQWEPRCYMRADGQT